MGAWSQLGHVSPRHLEGARLEVHHACQLVAIAVGRALLSARDDDSHTALTWLDVPAMWVCGDIPGTGGIRAGLRPADLVLTLGGKDDPAGDPLDLVGRSLEDGLAWLRRQLAEHGIDGERVALDLHYEMPAHPVADGAAFSPELAAERGELAHYFAAASMLLAEVAREHRHSSPIRTWPHHFDIATLLPCGKDGEGRDQSVGVGLSPGDDSFTEPYFYVSPWPFPDGADLPPLPCGHWHHEGFNAAVLTATELLGGEPESRARDFVTAAVAAGKRLLSD